MCENAKIYNEPKSQIYKDANVLQKMVEEFEGTESPKPVALTNGRTPHKRAAAAVDNASATPAGPDPKAEEAMAKIIDGLLNAVDEETGETMFEDFRNLVSRKEYPEYYKVIKEPMSLNTVRKRILAHKYPGWLEFERDLHLIVTNAEEFNEEESDIVKLAHELRRQFEAALLRARGSVEKPVASVSSIKLKLNMKPEAQVQTPASAPKLKLTLRNQRASPDVGSLTSASGFDKPQGQVHGNGQIAKVPQQNGVLNGKVSNVGKTPAAGTSSAMPAVQRTPIPPPPIEASPEEVKAEPNGPASRPRRSPGETPKPTKVLPVRKSRTPALLPESESITVVPRSKQISPSNNLSALTREGSGRNHSLTPGVDHPVNMASPASSINNAPTPGATDMRSTMSPAIQHAALSSSGPIAGYAQANGVDPRFRPPGKGIEDALISNLTVATHPNLNLSSPVEYSFSADANKSFQNHVVFFEAQHNILLITLNLGPTMQGRPYTASITVNGHRLFFNTIQPNPNRRRDDQATLACDVRLIPGRVTHIEVFVIAGQKGTKAGMGEQEQEKFTVDAFLHYE
ncbi:hypothetical protein BDZ91DRAFT_62333 [Kalaharituber pfeilii]|nr:hypothetical protein BDZ91DRAFT_62333 [Kalaharituber pfeilii]